MIQGDHRFLRTARIMTYRGIRRAAASIVSALLLTPFFQAPATKLAEKLHFDTAFADQWEPAVQLLSDLAQNPWYIFAAGSGIGLAAGLWLEAALRGRGRLGDTASLAARSAALGTECVTASTDVLKDRARWEQSRSDAVSGADPRDLGNLAFVRHQHQLRAASAMGAEHGTRVLKALSDLKGLGVMIPAFADPAGWSPSNPPPLYRAVAYHLTDMARFLGVIGQTLKDNGLEDAKRAALRWEALPDEYNLQKRAVPEPTAASASTVSRSEPPAPRSPSSPPS